MEKTFIVCSYYRNLLEDGGTLIHATSKEMAILNFTKEFPNDQGKYKVFELSPPSYFMLTPGKTIIEEIKE